MPVESHRMTVPITPSSCQRGILLSGRDEGGEGVGIQHGGVQSPLAEALEGREEGLLERGLREIWGGRGDRKTVHTALPRRLQRIQIPLRGESRSLKAEKQWEIKNE